MRSPCEPSAKTGGLARRDNAQRRCTVSERIHASALLPRAVIPLIPRVLIDYARERGAFGRPSDVVMGALLNGLRTGEAPVEDLASLEAALTRLEAVDPREAKVV